MAVTLASLKADLDREAKGDWVDYPDWPGVRFNVSSLHLPAYTVARDIMFLKLARKHKGGPIPDQEQNVELGKLYAKHLLHDWAGLDVPYSKEKAAETLSDPEFRNVVAAVQWCAAKISDIDVVFVEDASKNSERPSGGA